MSRCSIISTWYDVYSAAPTFMDEINEWLQPCQSHFNVLVVHDGLHQQLMSIDMFATAIHTNIRLSRANVPRFFSNNTMVSASHLWIHNIQNKSNSRRNCGVDVTGLLYCILRLCYIGCIRPGRNLNLCCALICETCKTSIYQNQPVSSIFHGNNNTPE